MPTKCQGQFVAVPVELFADWFPTLPGNAVKTLLYIIRRTKGWGKDEDAISISQFLHGITRRDGVQVDKGAGVPESSLRRALATLERCGLIQRIKRLADDGGTLATLYRLIIPGSRSEPPAPAIVEDTPPATETPTTHDPIQQKEKQKAAAPPFVEMAKRFVAIDIAEREAQQLAMFAVKHNYTLEYVQLWCKKASDPAIHDRLRFLWKMFRNNEQPSQPETPPMRSGVWCAHGVYGRCTECDPSLSIMRFPDLSF